MTVPDVSADGIVLGSAVGIVLAAGAGTRAGGPKAVRAGWLDRAVAALHEGGCDEVLVVLGARADQAALLVPDAATVVIAGDWSNGLSASLRAGLVAADRTNAEVAVFTLVDLPDMPAEAVSRVLRTSVPLARAAFGGRPGHPVRVSPEHWSPMAASVSGDIGAGPYLRDHDAALVECGDLWDGADIDE